ncbi:hypothetical protein Chor_011391 [Crotalus horridus]
MRATASYDSPSKNRYAEDCGGGVYLSFNLAFCQHLFEEHKHELNQCEDMAEHQSRRLKSHTILLLVSKVKLGFVVDEAWGPTLNQVKDKTLEKKHWSSPEYSTSTFLLLVPANILLHAHLCLHSCKDEKTKLLLMSNVKNNVGRGLNIALINGTTGQLIKIDSFDMYSGDIKILLDFMKGIKKGTLVLLASYDDPATKLNDEARKLFSDLGSKYVSQMAFRDNWIFLGGSGLKSKSPFEQYLKNDKETNKYDGWPEVLEMEGCVPKRID